MDGPIPVSALTHAATLALCGWRVCVVLSSCCMFIGDSVIAVLLSGLSCMLAGVLGCA